MKPGRYLLTTPVTVVEVDETKGTVYLEIDGVEGGWALRYKSSVGDFTPIRPREPARGSVVLTENGKSWQRLPLTDDYSGSVWKSPTSSFYASWENLCELGALRLIYDSEDESR